MTIPPRCGVVDLGSNSVRLVIFQGQTRSPMPIFNEKAVLRLGKGMQVSGRLNEEAVEQALTILQRYHAIARAMHASPFEILATAAVREASNGQEFVNLLRGRMPDVPIHILSGQQEAAFSADGVLCGMPDADGIMADIGGGSLEVVRLYRGVRGVSQTLKLGVIRLAERSNGELGTARAIADEDLATVPWLQDSPNGDLYLVGGAWRALARIHQQQTSYPIAILHHYIVGRDEAVDLAGLISSVGKRVLERLPGAPRRRIDDLPYAAIVLRRLLRMTSVQRVVFSATGLREGWFLQKMPTAVQVQDPVLSAARGIAELSGRDVGLPDVLIGWMAPLFPSETPEQSVQRKAACWISDIGSLEHPEFRAEQAFLRVLRHPDIGLDHAARAFLALSTAIRYDCELDNPMLRPARQVLAIETTKRAETIGMALRLAYTLSGGTAALLRASRLHVDGARLVLGLRANSGVFSGESVVRRLGRLASLVGLVPVVEAWRDP